MPDNDIILEDGVQDDPKLFVIDNQIGLIQCLMDIEGSLYDAFDEDRIKVITMALKVISKAQKKILDEL